VAFHIDASTGFGARVEQRLRDEQVIWMVTVNPDGTPEPSPVWFYWDGDTFLIYSRKGTPRERNIRRNGRVSLRFDGNGKGGNIVVFVGDATIDENAPPPYAMPDYAEKYRAGFARIGRTAEEFAYAYPLPVRVRPTRLRGF
jgi:PPOX class probable F420-dependent enzyme